VDGWIESVTGANYLEIAMPLANDPIVAQLLDGLNDEQKKAVLSTARQLLIIAGAGSGKTEVMARRIAWLVHTGTQKDSIVAFTFTEKTAEEMKFRIRKYIQLITPPGEDVTLGGMYIGTIHGFCLKMLREYWADSFYNFDILDELGQLALVQKGYYGILGMTGLETACGKGQYATIDFFLNGYALMQEYGHFEVALPPGEPPDDILQEAAWVKLASLKTDVGTGPIASAFKVSAARYYAYLMCRRFLDFSTSQSELLRRLTGDKRKLAALHEKVQHVVVDEVQDINPVQDQIIHALIGKDKRLTAVGDHRQAIYGWRGGRVEIMGKMFKELNAKPDGEVRELPANFRSTDRIIKLANRWSNTIGPVGSMPSPAMTHGRNARVDYDPTHVGYAMFSSVDDESQWIANQIDRLVCIDAGGNKTGAAHNDKDGERGVAYSDIAVLIRSSTDARKFMTALQDRHIPAVFRAGADLYSQPEALLFLALLSRMAGVPEFNTGAKPGEPPNQKSLAGRALAALGAGPDTAAVVKAACKTLRSEGLTIKPDVAIRLISAADLIQQRISGGIPTGTAVNNLKTKHLKEWLSKKSPLRRVFPQMLYHWVLSEAEVGEWEATKGRGETALFHVGALSSLITGIEMPGWTSPDSFKFQIIALCHWGSRNARTEEAPFLVQPDAVTISTIHAAKGLEYAAVFLADVRGRRFPSQKAGRVSDVPFSGKILDTVNPAHLADNPNVDGERRLMYVGLTRAERCLFVTGQPYKGKNPRDFFTTVADICTAVGGTNLTGSIPKNLRLLPTRFRRDIRLVTSFSELRYYLECPHDFYLRKVLGFAPTIDQAFGYGRGVHNLMRAIHADPARWAALARNETKLKGAVTNLLGSGLFYLRYTIGDPLMNMRNRAVKIVSEYIKTYAAELAKNRFEPEKEFETLIEKEQVLVSGAIDVIRLDDPPRVSLVDFKAGTAGDPDGGPLDKSKLDERLMRLQISLYALAAKHELEYEPDEGLVRYLGESNRAKQQLRVDFKADAMKQAEAEVAGAAAAIRDRSFNLGPAPGYEGRCAHCDHNGFCGRKEAQDYRAGK
jgi:DNA helicase-2/ATP-dependent DNA helicase PcrA